nr:Type 1 glutamine amidotransferase-like domain-containing protein [Rhodococcus sp. HNM0569]
MSSYRFGPGVDELVRVWGGTGRVAVVAAALDAWPETARRSAVTSELGPLRAAGFDADELDLRPLVGRPDALRARLRGYDHVWVRGGNTFVLRAQLARTGADHALHEAVSTGALDYGGYSAGACVATPTLVGLDSSDDPTDARRLTGAPAVWEGLGLVDVALVVHCPRPGAPALATDEEIEAATSALRAAGRPYVRLTDADAVVTHGAGWEFVSPVGRETLRARAEPPGRGQPS